jgi:hypothetical protein
MKRTVVRQDGKCESRARRYDMVVVVVVAIMYRAQHALLCITFAISSRAVVSSHASYPGGLDND